MFLTTTNDVIDAVGGTRAFAKWIGADDRAVSAWRRNGFPAAKFLLMQARLKADFNIEAPPELWGQEQP